MKIFVTGAGGFIGGSIAARLVRAGHQVRGLIRTPEQARRIEAARHRTGDRHARRPRAADRTRRSAADAVINAASSDHRGAVEALIDGLAGSGKPLLHTSGSSIVGDASGGEAALRRIYHEDALPEPTADKAARVGDRQSRARCGAARHALGRAVQHADLRSRRGARQASVQLPRLVRQARKSGVVRHVGSGGNIWSNVHIDDVADAVSASRWKRRRRHVLLHRERRSVVPRNDARRSPTRWHWARRKTGRSTQRRRNGATKWRRMGSARTAACAASARASCSAGSRSARR